MANPDVSLIATQLCELGGDIVGKKVNEWDFSKDGILYMKNVKKPVAMSKISMSGGPRPYRTQRDSSGNKANLTNRLLEVFQSKWDLEDIDPENLRNTYLASKMDRMYKYIADQAAKEYLSKIVDNVLGSGVRNASGSATADLCDGWLTIIADEITATNLTEVVTGAATSSNAVEKTEIVVDALPAWMLKSKFRVYCSYGHLANYRKRYRALNGFKFDPNNDGEYPLDGTKGVLSPQAWMGTSGRLIATQDENLVFGTDSDQVQVHATPELNIIKTRLMMPVGCQIQDLDALFVNDQA